MLKEALPGTDFRAVVSSELIKMFCYFSCTFILLWLV